MSGGRVVIASRASRLAIAQAEEIKYELKRFYPELEFEIRRIKTTADIKKGLSYRAIGEENIFTRQIDEALLQEEIDLAVHSMKDVPTQLPDRVLIAAITRRRNPADVLVAKGRLKLKELPEGAGVGTGSLRRRAQLLKARRDLNILDIRGNLDTRLKKLWNGNFDAIVVAQAGLERLNYKDLEVEILDREVMLPAVGQGSLAVVSRVDDEDMVDIASKLNDRVSASAVLAERAFLKALGGGCRIPVGGLGTVEDGRLRLEGIVLSPDGRESVRSQAVGEIEKAESIGRELAKELLSKGAGRILR